MSVVVKDLTKIFGKQKALDQVAFEAREGEVLGFLGPNGAGKSTTMKIATCFLPPDAGTIEVCGLDVRYQSLQVRQKIGYLPEHNPLYYDMYVHEYLHFVGGIHFSSKAKLRARIREMIEVCGLEVEQNKKIGALSKGYRQRVGLAQAMIHDPEVLILDEPTTGLDPNQILEIRALIKNMSQNKTVLFSTHIMQEVQAICDRVVIINKGKIVADAAPEALRNTDREMIVSVEFKEPVEIGQLEKLEMIRKAEALAHNKFRLYCQHQDDVRPAIFKFATDNHLTLLELRQEPGTIEDVFRSLTQKSE